MEFTLTRILILHVQTMNDSLNRDKKLMSKGFDTTPPYRSTIISGYFFLRSSTKPFSSI